MTWTGFFLIDRKVQLDIDNYDNKDKDIETGIPQGSPVSPILFIIYINGVTDKVLETISIVISLLFVNVFDLKL